MQWIKGAAPVLQLQHVHLVLFLYVFVLKWQNNRKPRKVWLSGTPSYKAVSLELVYIYSLLPTVAIEFFTLEKSQQFAFKCRVSVQVARIISR